MAQPTHVTQGKSAFSDCLSECVRMSAVVMHEKRMKNQQLNASDSADN